MADDWVNQLYFGDNLDVLREHIPDESVDLIYLDPPFNSNATYNVLFRERSGEESAAQITAFEDTWQWSIESERAYQDVVTRTGGKLGELLQAMRSFLGPNDMMAYLTMMAQRLEALNSALKPTGSIYLHCDPTASHYLKLLMDAVFGVENYRNEIIWKRSSAHSDARGCGRTHDTLLRYSKNGDGFVWNKQYVEYDADYIRTHYRFKTDDGRVYRTDNLTATGLQGGGYEYEWNGVLRVWRRPRQAWRSWTAKGGFATRATALRNRSDIWTRCPAFRCKMCGSTFSRSIRKRGSGSGTLRKSPKRCWNESSTPAATRAMSCSIRSAAAGRPSPSPNA